MILGYIQARLGSRRFPHKVLREVLGKPLLWYQYERMRAARLLDKVVIATADTQENIPLIEFATRNGIEYFAGSENDLLDRAYQTVKNFEADYVVPIGADCPLADPEVIDLTIEYFLSHKEQVDFVSNTIRPTYPDGLDLHVTSLKILSQVWREIEDPFWREWGFSYIIEHPHDYRLGSIENEKDYSHLRWTVDYEEDFDFVRRVIETLYPAKKIFLMDDILKLLQREPGLLDINKHYIRNSAYTEAKEAAKKF